MYLPAMLWVSMNAGSMDATFAAMKEWTQCRTAARSWNSSSCQKSATGLHRAQRSTAQNSCRRCTLRPLAVGSEQVRTEQEALPPAWTRGVRGASCTDILTNGVNSRFLVTNVGWHSGPPHGTLSPSVLGPQPPQGLELTVLPAWMPHSRAHCVTI